LFHLFNIKFEFSYSLEFIIDLSIYFSTIYNFVLSDNFIFKSFIYKLPTFTFMKHLRINKCRITLKILAFIEEICQLKRHDKGRGPLHYTHIKIISWNRRLLVGYTGLLIRNHPGHIDRHKPKEREVDGNWGQGSKVGVEFTLVFVSKCDW
jgi:hypothetical protein